MKYRAPLIICAAVAFVSLAVSTETVAQQPPGACGEVEVEQAMANFDHGENVLKLRMLRGPVPSRSESDAVLAQLYVQQDAEIGAAMRLCRKGATIAVPPRYVSAYCDMNKSTSQVPYKTVCVKR